MIFDLIAAHQQPSAAPQWTPELLFLPGDVGAWYDGSDYSTMFMDTAGSLSVTGPDQPVGLWKPAYVAAPTPQYYNLQQGTAEYRPITRTVNGKKYLDFKMQISSMQSIRDEFNYSAVTLAAGASVNFSSPLVSRIVTANVDYSAVILSTGADQANMVLVAGGYYRSSNFITSDVPFVGMQVSEYSLPVKTVLDTVTTEGDLFYVSTTYAQIVAADFNADTKLSQIVFINRAISAAEISKLASFIASKQ